MRKCDILIIGAGIAGATAALLLAQRGFEVILLSAGEESNSSWAQGGIVFRGVNDTPQLLAQDIEEAGAGLCNPAAVQQLVQRGPEVVEEIFLHLLQVPFDRTAEGALALTEEAAHSRSRILHCKDQTGKAMMDLLLARVESEPRIALQKNAVAVDLITLSHHSKQVTDLYEPSTCVGAYVLDAVRKQVEIIFARETILATGGLGEVFLHTTNPKQARGDGIAMAYRAGARIMNLEYVQFHPTTLYIPGERRFLLSEALRGEGARLLDIHGSPFMHRYHEKAELAPRDIVSRAIFSEMVAHCANHLWLDLSHKDKSWIERRFPAIYAHCLHKGFDLAAEPVPIVPAAHYSCGGVAVDLKGNTTLHRLRAIGEISCTGLHGANRLASTSLLEGIVWAKTAADAIAVELPHRSDRFPEVEEWHMSHEKVDVALIQQDWLSIQQTMWNYVGLVRDQARLRRAQKMLRELQWEIDQFYEKGELTSELVGLRNGALTALLIAQAAWKNRHSRGTHYRVD
jgi:L-aspartate oxidase